MSPPRTHTHQERLRDDLERSHLRDYNDFCRARGRAPPDHYYRDLGILHSSSDQLSLALAESRWGGRFPVIASPRVAPPSDAPRHPRPDSSSLQGPRLSPLLVLPLKIVVVQVTPPAIFLIAVTFQRSATTNHSFLAPDIATIGDSVQGSPFLLTSGSRLQGVPPLHSEWDSLQGGPLLQSEWDSPQGVPPLHSEWDSLQGGPRLLCEWNSLQGGPFLQSEWDSPLGVPPPHSEWDSLQGGPFLQSEWDSPQGGPPLQCE